MKLYDRNNALTAVDMLNDRVLPFFEEQGVPMLRILSFPLFSSAKGAGSCGHCLLMLIADPTCKKSRRRSITERRVPATAVVKHLDVVEQIGNRRLARSVPGAMHALVLQTVEEALGRRVIPAIPLAAHRANHVVLRQLVLKPTAGVLAATIRVMDQPGRRSPAEPSHGQRVDDNVRAHPSLDRPPDDFPVEQIEHYRQVQPAFVRPDIRQIGGPGSIGRRRCNRAPARCPPPAAHASNRSSP